jgi:O-antigen/teichoic acid export membrane protein
VSPEAQVRPAGEKSHAVILRNAFFLVISQAIVTPLSLVINAVMGRYLGTTAFGELYLAGTFAGFGFLLVEWGQGALLTGEVARDRTRAGELLGSSIVFRLAASVVVGVALVLVAFYLGKDAAFATVLLLVVVSAAMGTVVGAAQDVVRGFERMDFGAASYVGWQVLRLVVVVPTVLAGGRIRAVLVAQAVCGAIGLVVVLRLLGRVGVPRLGFRGTTVKELFARGTPFLVFGLATALQLNVDALFMARYASPEAVGWYAAASKLQGALVYPAGVLIAAIYPTLCRLHVEDLAAYRRTAAAALRTTTILVVPVALCCFLYPDVGVRLYSRDAFRPAEDDLRIMAAYLFLVYFSMPVGTSLVAAGKQRAWAITQFGCVVSSLVLSPLLIRRFQASHGNGGLGVCLASVCAEVLMVIIGVALLPRGIFDRTFRRKLALALLAAAVMAGVGLATLRFTSFVSAPLALGAYLLCLRLTGVLDRSQLETLRGLVRRRAPVA